MLSQDKFVKKSILTTINMSVEKHESQRQRKMSEQRSFAVLNAAIGFDIRLALSAEVNDRIFDDVVQLNIQDGIHNALDGNAETDIMSNAMRKVISEFHQNDIEAARSFLELDDDGMFVVITKGGQTQPPAPISPGEWTGEVWSPELEEYYKKQKKEVIEVYRDIGYITDQEARAEEKALKRLDAKLSLAYHLSRHYRPR